MLDPDKGKPEGEASVKPEGTNINKKQQMTTKQIATRKIHANNLQTKLSHPG